MKEAPYVSSIVHQYGDVAHLGDDVYKLRQIIDRQGISLLIRVIADYTGECCIRFKWTEEESKRVRDSYVNQLREDINERI